MPLGILVNALSVIVGGGIGLVVKDRLDQDFKEKLNMIFGVYTLGGVVSLIAIPQLVIFLALFFGANLIYPLTTPAMIDDFKAAGGMIMLATGFRMIKVKMFPTADMIPAMILVMPVSWMWVEWIMPFVG